MSGGREEMNEKLAEEMLAVLSDYYNEPVMPVRAYCRALEAWAKVQVKNEAAEIAEKVKELRENPTLAIALGGERGITSERNRGWRFHLDSVLLAIRKSNLLHRLIYLGEPLRTEMCPEHKGRWSGCQPEPCPHGCSSGINVTGWLPVK